MIKIFVFDTNSLISANLLPGSVNRKAYDKACEIGILDIQKQHLPNFPKPFIAQSSKNTFRTTNDDLR